MGKIIKVSGPLVVADGMADASMADVVRVGSQQLIGEILNMTGEKASIQVYEETSGLGPGAEVVTTGAPLSVELGPGLIENIYDGIQRPLEEIVRRVGANITRGIQVPPLDREKLWSFTPTAKVRCGHRDLYRLRRAGQRDDRRTAGVPGADRPPHRRESDEADGAHRQHLRHAGGRPRGIRLYGYHHCGILPGHGL